MSYGTPLLDETVHESQVHDFLNYSPNRHNAMLSVIDDHERFCGCEFRIYDPAGTFSSIMSAEVDESIWRMYFL